MIIISIPAFVYSTTSRLSLLTDNDNGTISDFQMWEMLSTEPIPEELSHVNVCWPLFTMSMPLKMMKIL